MTGPQKKRLRDALVNAFGGADDLEQMVQYGLDRNLNRISTKPNLDARVFDLIQHFERIGQIDALLRAARDENPGNAELAAVVLELGGEMGTEPEVPEGRGGVERILETSSFQDPELWLATMAARLKTVCRVERGIDAPVGTGFLVGPSLVMTNHHVLDAFGAGAEPVFRFDYRLAGDAITGAEYRVKKGNWKVAGSPQGKLDYALVELGAPAGKESPGKGMNAVERGYLRLQARELKPDEPLVIVQHPAGRTLKMAFGAVRSVSQPERVTYSVSTEGGSSGSPCFNSSLELVGLHFWGSAKENAAIRAGAILEDLAKAGVALGG